MAKLIYTDLVKGGCTYKRNMGVKILMSFVYVYVCVQYSIVQYKMNLLLIDRKNDSINFQKIKICHCSKVPLWLKQCEDADNRCAKAF